VTPLEELALEHAPVAVLDFETTGLYPSAGDRVIEVAVVRREDGRVRSYSQLIQPERDIPARATEIHGLVEADLAGAPTFGQIADELLSWLDGALVVAHHARFDLGFLDSELRRLGRGPAELGPVVCTVEMARNLFGLARCNLVDLSARVGVGGAGRHRALLDATCTLGVYDAMLSELPEQERKSPQHLIDRIAALHRRGAWRQFLARRLEELAVRGQTVVVDYTAQAGPGPLTIRRPITIRRVRWPNIEAWCHLRQEERIFHIRRIQRIVEPAGLPLTP
jgi:DNA polymerase-3 subunit epsilon